MQLTEPFVQTNDTLRQYRSWCKMAAILFCTQIRVFTLDTNFKEPLDKESAHQNCF